ncbi:uncharacterized protein G2W53_037685 [Senna tora]|uniref:Uncharacterized protein n=1 Tax=Senna tora TaxID=362788 RepID=A0A834SKM2_9FABA|nr:uncharacterized protein G2W53_037685 [Senna tora]
MLAALRLLSNSKEKLSRFCADSKYKGGVFSAKG